MEISDLDAKRYAADYETNKLKLEQILAPAEGTPHREQWIAEFRQLLAKREPIQDILATLSEKYQEQ